MQEVLTYKESYSTSFSMVKWTVRWQIAVGDWNFNVKWVVRSSGLRNSF
jgi:hypothetical protein